MFAAAPEPDPAGPTNGGRATGFASAVPGGWLWEADLQGRYTWCSPEVERFLGWRSRDLIGKEVAAVGFTHESAEMLRPMIGSGRPVDGLRLEARANDGSEIQLLFSAQLRPGLTGKAAGFRGAVQVLSMAPPVEPQSEAPAKQDLAPAAPAAPLESAAPAARRKAEEVRAAQPAVTAASAGTGDEPVIDRTTVGVPEQVPLPPPAGTVEEAPRPPARGTSTLPRRQTGALYRPQTGPLATQLVVSAPVPAEEVKPIEPPPLVPVWGATTAYVDSAQGIQPMASEAGQAITEPRIDGSRLLVPIRVQDEVLGVLAFDENEEGRAWTEDDVTMALAISEQLAVALQDARSVRLTELALEEMREADRLKTQFLASGTSCERRSTRSSASLASS
jgi:PAS domain S-box-containing protein